MPNARVKKGSVVYGVVVRAAMQKSRVDGSQIKFDWNGVVLLYTFPRAIEMNIRNSERRQIFGPVWLESVWSYRARYSQEQTSQDPCFESTYC
ncbi:unnamed protein product [Microthlaspi erraticum]|uniref:Uncharacterized protein n=1 Tax=Microthlaspi erraticum TaxID=1685480 RepID=A0A6D2I5D6_9BRAS|nr:unnamed protein product [Microthlaspi erraticum]